MNAAQKTFDIECVQYSKITKKNQFNLFTVRLIWRKCYNSCLIFCTGSYRNQGSKQILVWFVQFFC